MCVLIELQAIFTCSICENHQLADLNGPSVLASAQSLCLGRANVQTDGQLCFLSQFGTLTEGHKAFDRALEY